MNSKLTFRRFCTLLQTAILACGLTLTAQAAGEVDSTFQTAIQEDGSFCYVQVIVPQPDGKLLVGGSFTVAGNSGRTGIARLNADGTVDDTFVPPDFYKLVPGTSVGLLRIAVIRAIAVQSDGKILVGGDFQRVGSQTKFGVARLNGDGSLDSSFNPVFNFGLPDYPVISDIKVQADSRIVLGGLFNFFQNSVNRTNIARLNSDGSVDESFAPQNVTGEVKTIAIQSDGKVIYGGNSSAAVRRVAADGSADNNFLDGAFAGGNPLIENIALQPDGKILVGGSFSVLSSSPVQRMITRLNANGTIDTTFNTGGVGANNIVRSVAVLPDGKIIIVGVFNLYNNTPRNKIARLGVNGTLDPTFNFGNNIQDLNSVATLNDGGFIIGGVSLQNVAQIPLAKGLARFDAAGTVNAAFQGGVYQRGSVNRAIAQADGKVLVGGLFRQVNGFNREFITRLNQNGTLDTAFNPTVTGGLVNSVAQQSDGKIIVVGTFTQINGVSRNSVARLNQDGTLDTTFQATLFTATVDEVIVLPDGKILVAGNFRLSEYSFTLNVARLNQNGSTDTTFVQSQVNTPGLVRAMKVQPDGKIVVGGTFTQIAGANRGRIARLNADGSLDDTFSPPFGANNAVNDLAIQSNGSIVIGGEFLSVNGGAIGTSAYLARLLPDGTKDNTFTSSANNLVYAVATQSDNKILVGGSFSEVNAVSRNGIARLNAGGTIDNSFGGTGTNDLVRSISIQTDGNILIGGEFSRINQTTKNIGVARLLSAPTAVRTAFDFDGDGRADIAVFRPSNGNWYQLRSANNAFNAVAFGQSNDRIAPADYDGDGKTDIAVFRDVVPGAGNFAYFYILNSADNSFRPVQFGATGDVPVSGDWDADGKADLAVYRDGTQTGGQSYFYYRPSSQPNVNFNQIAWGGAGDKPLVGDFDGDGRLDAAVFRPATAAWYVLQSSNNQVVAVNFGLSTDVPVPADYDGDGRANIAVFRPSTGTWFTSTNAAVNYGAIPFGAAGDLPVPADYDGDGRADVAVYRPTTGAWYLQRSQAGFTGIAFGDGNDKPIPNAFIR